MLLFYFTDILSQGIPGGDATFGSPVPPDFAARTMKRRKRSIRTEMVADEPELNMYDMPPTPTLGKSVTKKTMK